jgi:hypothetical protein
MSLTPNLLQNNVSLVPEALTGYKDMRDGLLTLTAHNLTFVQRQNKVAQIVPYGILVVLIILFFIRAINGTLPLRDSSIMTFSWAAAITMLLYCGYRLHRIVTAPANAFQLDIPLISIAQLAEEQLKFTRGRRILRVKTYMGKSHRFATTSATADWIKAIGDSLQTNYDRSLQFQRDGDIATWQVKSAS